MTSGGPQLRIRGRVGSYLFVLLRHRLRYERCLSDRDADDDGSGRIFYMPDRDAKADKATCAQPHTTYRSLSVRGKDKSCRYH